MTVLRPRGARQRRVIAVLPCHGSCTVPWQGPHNPDPPEQLRRRACLQGRSGPEVGHAVARGTHSDGLNLENLTDEEQIAVEDDYRICVKRKGEEADKSKRGQKRKG